MLYATLRNTSYTALKHSSLLVITRARIDRQGQRLAHAWIGFGEVCVQAKQLNSEDEHVALLAEAGQGDDENDGVQVMARNCVNTRR